MGSGAGGGGANPDINPHLLHQGFQLVLQRIFPDTGGVDFLPADGFAHLDKLDRLGAIAVFVAGKPVQVDLGHLGGHEPAVVLINGLDILQGRYLANNVACLFQVGQLSLEFGQPLGRGLGQIGPIRDTQNRALVGGGVGQVSPPVLAQNCGGQDHPGDILGEQAHMVQGGRDKNQAGRINAVVAWFEADDATIGRGPDDRADSLGSQGQGTESRRNGGGRATAGAAGGVGQIMGVTRWARGEIGKFGGDGFAQNQGP